MSHISDGIKKIVVLFVLGALIGLVSTALGRRGADDFYPHARSNTGIVSGGVVVSGDWGWFRWLGPAVLRKDYAHRGGRWYSSQPGRHESRGEGRAYDDDDSRGRRDDDKGRGGRRDGKDDNPGRSNRRGRSRR